MMKFTLAWLKEHLDTDRPLGELADKLTMIGLEVEHIDDQAKALAPFTIARVISAEQHPNADRLRVCMVDTGDDIVQVVCGAPNAHTGMKAVFAAPGNRPQCVRSLRRREGHAIWCEAALVLLAASARLDCEISRDSSSCGLAMQKNITHP